MKKFFKIFFITVFIIIILVIAAAAVFIKLKLNKIHYEKVTRKDIDINEGIEEQLEEYTNIAILGLDARDNTFENSRSDCIMILSINNKTKKVNVFSVYRDTYVEIQGHGLDKINHAYAYNKAPLAISTINKNLDLDITEYITINFESVVDIIDEIGGVTVDITSTEATQIPGISQAGTYNLNGQQALAYGRIRKIDSDYARTERMRTVLIKVFEKAKALTYTRLNDLTDKLLPKVSTNMTQGRILSFIGSINQYEVKKNFGWPYEVRGITFAAWYGVPVTLETNVKQLHEELFSDEEYEVSDTVKEISKSIVNKTGYSK